MIIRSATVYYDKETEEVYLRARYYQPAMGRFLTRDTYTGESDDPESLHLYTYCENDGVSMVDPSGHDSYVSYDKNAKAGTKGKMFKDEAKIVQKRLKKKYRKPCHNLGVRNAKQFAIVWKNLGKIISLRKRRFERVKIQEVYLIFHGSIGGNVGDATGYMYCDKDLKIMARKADFYNSEKDVLISKLAKRV